MIKMTITNEAKLEASWEIMKDDLGINIGNSHYSKIINDDELRLLYRPFCHELHQVFGELPEITDFDCALTHLFNHDEYKRQDFNAMTSADCQQARKAFDVFTKYILSMIGYTSKDFSKILMMSYQYKDGSIEYYKCTTFNLK